MNGTLASIVKKIESFKEYQVYSVRSRGSMNFIDVAVPLDKCKQFESRWSKDDSLDPKTLAEDLDGFVK